MLYHKSYQRYVEILKGFPTAFVPNPMYACNLVSSNSKIDYMAERYLKQIDTLVAQIRFTQNQGITSQKT